MMLCVSLHMYLYRVDGVSRECMMILSTNLYECLEGRLFMQVARTIEAPPLNVATQVCK